VSDNRCIFNFWLIRYNCVTGHGVNSNIIVVAGFVILSQNSRTAADIISRKHIDGTAVHSGFARSDTSQENELTAVAQKNQEEDPMDSYIFYGLTAVLLTLSFFKDKKKTKMALKKAWKAFENILPEFLVVILLVGLMLALLNAGTISKIIGSESGWFGVILASIIGSITLIPGFVAFPMAALLVGNGAGYMQIAAFISTLMMVGIVTMPVEIKYFGKKATIGRNMLAFAFSFIVASVIGMVVM